VASQRGLIAIVENKKTAKAKAKYPVLNTPGNVKLLLPPRQSRGELSVGLVVTE